MAINHSTGESPIESMLIDQVNELSEKYDTLRNRCNNVLEQGLRYDGIVARIEAIERKLTRKKSPNRKTVKKGSMNLFPLSVRQPRKPKRFPRAPVTRLPHRIWRRYRDLLTENIIDKWREAAVKIVIEHIPAIARQVEFERPGIYLDSWPDDISRQINLLRDECDKISAQANGIASDVFTDVNVLSRRAWYEQIKKAIGVEFVSYESWIQNESAAWIKENVGLITKLQAETVQDIDRIVTNGFRTGRRVEAIKKEILGTDLEPGRFKKVETRAELIARDQTGKLLGDLNQRRQEELGITIYIWRTAGDERVRDSHVALNGKYCLWKDPTVYADILEEALAGNWKSRSSINAYVGDPGSDFQCRCYPEPVFETLFE